jgi:hypothetical protein
MATRTYTKRQMLNQNRLTREWRKRNPKKAAQVSRDWRARNPGWWRGRNYVIYLTNALINGIAGSRVFKDAGMTMDEWIEQAPALLPGSITLLKDGWVLKPAQGWRKFDLSLPADVRRFLDPRNFVLVKK